MINELPLSPAEKKDPILRSHLFSLDELLLDLRHRNLSQKVEHDVNMELERLSVFSDSPEELIKDIKDVRKNILTTLQHEANLLASDHYRRKWLPLGLLLFGLPIGLGLSAVADSLFYVPVGLPMGLAIGYGIGIRLDNKAQQEGRQLNVESII